MLILVVVLFSLGCNNIFTKDNNLTYDDELIEKIINSSDKMEIEYNDLPVSIRSIMDNSYNTQISLSELIAADLGYELTLSKIDTYGNLSKAVSIFWIEGLDRAGYAEHEIREHCEKLLS